MSKGKSAIRKALALAYSARKRNVAKRRAMSESLAALILAAGKGTRMKSDLHKVLHPIAGRPMLGHLVEAVAALDPAHIVIVAGSGREQIEAFARPLGLSVAVQADQLGTAHAVAQGQAALGDFDGDVIILYGDVPLVSTETMTR